MKTTKPNWKDRRGRLDVARIRQKDIPYWTEYYFNMGAQKKQRDFYQAAVVENHPKVVFIAARGSGKTWAIRKAVAFILLYGRREEIIVFAPTEKQAKDNIFKELIKELQSDDDLWVQVKDYQKAGYLTMHNGNTLRVLTAAKDSNLRGAHPTRIIIDETQSVVDEKYDNDIMGTAASVREIDADTLRKAEMMEEDIMGDFIIDAGKIATVWETGTPLGRGHFHDTVMAGKATVIKQPYWDTVVVNRNHIAAEKERLSEREFEAEYCCVFHVDEDYAFERELLDIAMTIDPLEPVRRQADQRYHYAYGLDLGQKKDHTVFTMYEIFKNEIKMVFMKRFPRNLTYLDMAHQMDVYIQQWKPGYGLCDCTGQSAVPYEKYIRPMGWPGAGFEFINKSVGRLMGNMKLMLENKHIKLWKHDELRKEFTSQKEEHLAGFSYPRYPKPEKCRNDIVMSAALGCTAAMVYMNDYRLTDEIYGSITGDKAHVMEYSDSEPQWNIHGEIKQQDDWRERETTWGMDGGPLWKNKGRGKTW